MDDRKLAALHPVLGDEKYSVRGRAKPLNQLCSSVMSDHRISSTVRLISWDENGPSSLLQDFFIHSLMDRFSQHNCLIVLGSEHSEYNT